jgi:hypothetical protein
MKWSQALCASILVDGLCYAPEVRSNPRPDQDFPGVPADPASKPNALAVDFGAPKKPAGPRFSMLPDMAS